MNVYLAPIVQNRLRHISSLNFAPLDQAGKRQNETSYTADVTATAFTDVRETVQLLAMSPQPSQFQLSKALAPATSGSATRFQGILQDD